MANSLMQIISDGSLSTIPLTIKFFDQSHIKVFVNNVELPNGSYTFVWAGATTLTITPAVALGSEVSIRRKTPNNEVLHDFQAGAVFSEVSVDENFRQELFLLQEASEQSFVTDLYADLYMHGNKITQLGVATAPTDAVSLGQVEGLLVGDLPFMLEAELAAPSGIAKIGGVGYLTIEQFGGVRDNPTGPSQAFAIQLAHIASATTGLPIRDSGTYYVKGTDIVTVPGPSYPHALQIDASGLVYDFTMRDSVASSVTVGFGGVSGALMCGGGSAGPAVALASATYNSQTITTTGVSVGDLLLIYSDDTKEGDTSPQELGELNYVQTVSGTTVTLESKLKDNYTTNPKYRVVTPLKSLSIKGLKLRGKGRQETARGDLGMFLLFCTDAHIDVEVDGVDQVGVDLIACKDWYMRGYGRSDEKKASNEFVQYLYRYSSGSCDGTVEVHGRLSRHVCNGGSNVNIPGVNRNITVKGSATGTWHAGFSTHNGDELTEFDVTADSCDMGIDLRVGKSTVKSVVANQCRLGLLLRKDIQDISVGKVVAWGGDGAVLVTTAGHVASRALFQGIEIDDIDSYDQETAITINATVDPIPVQLSVGRVQSVRASPSGGNSAAIRALGPVQLSVGEARLVDSKNYDVSAEAGAIVYIDSLEIQDNVSAARILRADGAGSRVVVGRLILRGSTTSITKLEQNGGVVEVFQIVDLR